jgi:maleylacetoacetate isomerase/maleylpyruvate isomerase
MSAFKLFSYYRSSVSHRVRIVLAHKGVDYQYHPVHLLNNGGEQYSSEFLSLNPSGEVPVLIHDGNVLAQSVAIVAYLDRVCPEPRLFPADHFKRAQVIRVCEIINSGIAPLHNLKVLKHLEVLFGANEAQKTLWSLHWVRQGFSSLEKILSDYSGTYCFGDTITAADAFLIPEIIRVKRFGLDINDFPLLSKIHHNCSGHVSFQKACPECQPDTPGTC